MTAPEPLTTGWQKHAQGLLRYALFLTASDRAKNGGLLPGGRSVQDLVAEVYVAYATGRRRITKGVPLQLQLRSALRSQLSNLRQLNETKLTTVQGPEFFGPIAAEAPKPWATVEGTDFFQRLVELLKRHPRVLRSDRLRQVLAAFEHGAISAEDVIQHTGFSRQKVYYFQRCLWRLIRQISSEIHQDGDTHE